MRRKASYVACKSRQDERGLLLHGLHVALSRAVMSKACASITGIASLLCKIYGENLARRRLVFRQLRVFQLRTLKKSQPEKGTTDLSG